MVDLLISHEAPTFSLLPPPFCSIGIEGPMAVDLLYRTVGLDATMSGFASNFPGLGEDGTKMPEPGPRENVSQSINSICFPFHLSLTSAIIQHIEWRDILGVGNDLFFFIKGDTDSNISQLENFFKNEFAIGTFYCPDLRKLVQNNVGKRTGLLAGRRSRNALTAQTTVAQQEILECERMVIAGHHLWVALSIFVVDFGKWLRVVTGHAIFYLISSLWL